MDAENDRRKAHGHHQTRGRFRLQKKKKKTPPPPKKKGTARFQRKQKPDPFE